MAGWTARTIDSPDAWRVCVAGDCLGTLERVVRERLPARWQRETASEPRLTAAERALCSRALAPAAQALEQGRGFVIVDGVPLDRYTTEEAIALYWLAGQCLGEPLAQNVQGVTLYDVRDTGQDLGAGARFSVTSYESSFHTDNSFGAEVADYVGLFCLQTARSGGVSQVVDGRAVHAELRAHHAEVLAILSCPFHVDRRGGVRPGEAATVCRPVIEATEGGLLFRYLRYWIEVGHEKAQQPLTPAQLAALDTLDAVLRRPELRVDFELRRGDMYFLNNRWLLHNRTAFEDHPDPERRRHLVRLWLKTVQN